MICRDLRLGAEVDNAGAQKEDVYVSTKTSLKPACQASEAGLKPAKAALRSSPAGSSSEGSEATAADASQPASLSKLVFFFYLRQKVSNLNQHNAECCPDTEYLKISNRGFRSVQLQLPQATLSRLCTVKAKCVIG